MKIIEKVVTIQDVAKQRDKLVNLINKEFDGEQREPVKDVLVWIRDEIQDVFDFDGEEDA